MDGLLNFKEFKARYIADINEYLTNSSIKYYYAEICRDENDVEQICFKLSNGKATIGNFAKTIKEYQLYRESGDYDDFLSSSFDRLSESMPQARTLDPSKATPDDVMRSIIARVINPKINTQSLLNRPHRIVLDCAIVYEIYHWSGSDNMMTSEITNDLANQIGLNEAELWRLAFANTRKIFGPSVTLSDKHPLVTIENNGVRANGATNLIYSDLLDEAAKMLGSDKIIIEPTSIHELLVYPSGLEDAVLEYHREQDYSEYPYEFLSDNIYLYDVKTKKLEIYSFPSERNQSNRQHAETRN